MRRFALILPVLLLMLATACGGGSSGGSSGGKVSVTLWHGYVDAEGKGLVDAVKRFNATHPSIEVKLSNYGNADLALQKVLTAIRSGSAPDIAYLYGSYAANIARTPSAVDVAPLLAEDPSMNWEDFWPAERGAVEVGDKVIGVPALVDNLALVYNKAMFDQAGVAHPTADWTWDDFRQAAAKLTDPAKKQFGWAYVADASEDTVWRFDALLWQAGGDILTPDNQHAAFNSEAGVRAATLLQQMATVDHSVYLDNGNGTYANLFNSGKIGMLFTGPWDLSGFTDVEYGVEVLPGDQNHQTISGPDQWVMFDNGDDRSKAAWEFLKWFTSAEQAMQWSLDTGDLPIRASQADLPQYQEYVQKYPGVEKFVENEANAVKARPVIATYAEVSQAMGQAIQAVLLGKAQPKDGLDAAAEEVDQVLAQGS
ncbi:MAG: multiple sugar transport system substrate-binding protein [Gaiellales bacterium]|jgi:multiple sugar transport system substrate-binding protein|nr:multiple sugar transport system substrate-binding protein [Gaiellales bacterium]